MKMMHSKILHCDNRDGLHDIADESVNLIITSPPYKDVDGYSESLMRGVFNHLYRIQSPNSLFFLNFGHLAEDKFRPFSTCQIAIDSGYKLNETITWVKNHYKPIQGHRRLNNLTEFIFVLYKGKMPKLDRLAVGIPYADKSNARRFNGGLDLHCAGNVWYVNYPTINKSSQKGHNDRFPLELPTRCIKMCGYEVDTVLDPFMGSGTTCLASKNLGKKYIGMEMDESHYETAKKRLT
jgi:site-specific DNA-methyltransferase (adenine-specific)